MSELSQTTEQLLQVILHFEAATDGVPDDQETRRIITAAYRNAATINGIPGRPDPAGDFEGTDKVIAAGAALSDWAIKNVVITWGLDELRAAFENVEDHYWSAIGSDRVMTAVEPKLGKDGGTVDDWLKIRADFQADVDAWVKANGRHPICHHHVREQPIGGGKLKCFHLFYVDMLRIEISPFERAALAMYVSYLQQRLSDRTCEHVIDSLKMLRREVTKFRDRITELMKSSEPEIRERIQLIPFERRTAYLSIDELTYRFNAVQDAIGGHETNIENIKKMGSERGSSVEIDLRETAILIGENRVAFGSKGALWPIILKLVETYQKNPDSFTKWKELIPKNRPDWGADNIRGHIGELKKHFSGSGATVQTGDRSKGEQGYRFQVIIGKY